MKDTNTKKRRKDFFASLRQYSKKRKANRNFSDEYSEIDENGNVLIDVNMREGDVFSPYSDKKDLNGDAIEYIESTAYYIPIDRPLKIRFSGVEESEREAVRKAYRKRFESEFNDKCLDLRICMLKAICLLVIGFAFLALGIVVSRLDILWGLHEIFTVVASFTMWESVDFFLLERANSKAEKLDIAQLLLAELIFI